MIQAVVRRALRLLLSALFRVRVTGLENMPVDATAGWILAGVPHRNWVEPLLLHAYVAPAGKRVVTVADARAVSRSRLRRFAAGLAGGVVAVGPAAKASPIERIDTAASYVADGAVVAIFPEIGGPTPPPRLRRISAGVGHISAWSRGPVVPVVFGGTEELYLGRHIEIRVMPPATPPTKANRAAIGAWTATFAESVQEAADDAHERANAHQPRRKRWLWLTGNYPRA